MPYHSIPSSLAEHSSRLVEGIVHLGNGVHMFVASVYGPTHTTTFYDPWAILSKLCAEVFDHALAFKGPAVVMGDFNVVIEDLPRWNALRRAGWVDAAEFDAHRRQCSPQPTSKDKARKSFVLINPMLVQALTWCGTIEEHEFDSHPLLAADFATEVFERPVTKWWLPATTDQFMFDPECMEEQVKIHTAALQDKFHDALKRRDGDEAFRQFNLAFESCLQDSCVDAVGRPAVLPRRCLGRGTKKLCRHVRPSAPIVKPAREGHFNPEICQPSSIIRNMTKQVRRLQSLESQISAAVRSGSQIGLDVCSQVWNAVLSARGFFPSFQEFAMTTFGVFVPMSCPGVEYVHYLAQTLKCHLQVVVADSNKARKFERECRVLRDIQCGGSEAYKSVKDQPAPPFHAIVQELKACVVPLKWSKVGRRCLKVLSDGSGFDFQFPVYFQGQECFVEQVVGNKWHLDRYVKWRNVNDWIVTQRKVISDRDEMQRMTGQAWSELWRREPVDDSVDNWSEAFESLKQLPTFPAMDFQPISAQEWKSQVRSAPRKSARGSCGYTAKELLFMPDALVSWLLQIIADIEDGRFGWPKSMMVARVVMLGKGLEQPTCPLKTRPITITSRIYRTWARCRSLQVIQHLQSLLPAQVAGAAAGVSADVLAAKVMFEVEKALMTSTHKLGITIDLVKCFNQVPRLPILFAMRKLGVPEQVITALDSMFQNLKRVLELAGEVGDEWGSTTGVPEGCAMSLVSMLTLTAWAAGHIQSHVDDDMTEFLAYADNWGILADSFNDLRSGINSMFNFVQILRMKIATDKSWTWSTCPKSRAKLRSLEVEGASIPVKLVACDLGCDVAYCKRVTKKVTKGRILKASRVLRRVGSKMLPKKFKTRMAAQLSSSIPAFGSELVYHTPSELRVLRSATCKALGRSRAGNNPYLSTLVTEGIDDVAVSLLRRKVSFWRRFLNIFPLCAEDFLKSLAEGRNKNGVTAFLRRSFNDQGWTCRADGEIEHYRGWRLNWLRDSKCHVRKLLSLAWTAHVCQQVQHRPNFCVPCVDIPAFHRAIHDLEGPAKTDVLNLATGKHVTNDALVHYSKGVKTNKCPFCSMKDGRMHRVFHCQHTAKFREEHKETMAWLCEQETCVPAWGLLPCELDWADWRFENPAVFPILATPGYTDEVHVDVFTDGSAVGQGITGFTVAAASFVHCKGYTVVNQDAMPLPGNDHSAYRTEVWGVILALSRYRFVHIYTDCACVINNLTAALSAKRSRSMPKFSDHEDLWGIAWRLISEREVEAVIVTKVKAHQNVKNISDPTLRWMAYMNNKADVLAKKCIRKHWGLELDAVVDRLKTREADIAFLKDFHCMWRDINADALDKCKNERVKSKVVAPAFRLVFDPSQAVRRSCKVPEVAVQSCVYTAVFAERVVHYFDGLEWDFSQPAVSMLELYVDFVLSSGTVAPCLIHKGERGPQGPVRSYCLPDLDPEADVQQNTLREQSRVWSKVLAWLRKHADDAPEKPSLGCKSLTKYGYSQQHYGVAGCPKFRSGMRVLHVLWSYFNTANGTVSNMNRRLQIHRHAFGGG